MFQWKLAIRYFLHRPASWLAVAAVALCSFIVIVVLTVMNGLAADFKQKNHAFVGDCVITSDSLVGFPADPAFIHTLESQPYIAAVCESIDGVGLVTQDGADWNIGVQFMGIDPLRYSKVTGFARSLFYHQDTLGQTFVPGYAPQEDGCVAGIDLIGGRRTPDGQYAHPGSPAPIRLILSSFPLTAKGALARGGTDLVSSKTFYVSDDSHTGLPQIDGSMIYMPLQTAQLLTGMDSPVARISSIHLRFAPGTSLTSGVEKVRTLWREHLAAQASNPYAYLYDSVRVQSWLENRRSRIAAIEKEQNMLILLFLMLGIITVFIVFVIFYMLVGHKSRDIGILKSVGMARSRIARIFLDFAAMIGASGAAIGLTAGSIFLVYINSIEDWLFVHFDFQLWDRSVYAIGKIPNQIDAALLAGVAVSAVAACLLGAVIPAIQASRKESVQVLQVSQV